MAWTDPAPGGGVAHALLGRAELEAACLSLTAGGLRFLMTDPLNPLELP